MPKLDFSQISPVTGTTYPAPFDEPCKIRTALRLSDAGGITQFGANLMTLSPGTWSSQRHHHSHEDEIIYIVAGHPTLFEDSGATQLAPGDVTTHPMGDGVAHHMKNETDKDVVYLVIGGRRPEADHVIYPDIDLDLPANGTASRQFSRKDGVPY